jgi:hypothetical protein
MKRRSQQQMTDTSQGHKTWDKKGHIWSLLEVPSPTTTNTQGRTTTTCWDNNNRSQLSTPLNRQTKSGAHHWLTWWGGGHSICVLSHKHSLPLNLSIPSWMHILKTHCGPLNMTRNHQSWPLPLYQTHPFSLHIFYTSLNPVPNA